MGIYIWNNDVFNHHIWVSIMIKNGIKKEKLNALKINFSDIRISNFKKKVKLVVQNE